MWGLLLPLRENNLRRLTCLRRPYQFVLEDSGFGSDQTVEGLTQAGTVTKTVTEELREEEETTEIVEKYGEPPGTRTQDPRLKRAMLYQLS